MRRLIPWAGTALVTTTMLAACSGSGSSTGNTPPESIAKAPAVSGDAQTATVSTALPDSLRVIVKEDGAPLAGATVSWSTAGTGAAVSPATSQTDVAGLAATRWTTPSVVGCRSADPVRCWR